jgi:hypothetical protein
MQGTLYGHIMRLEHRIQALRDQLTEGGHSAPERNRLSEELRTAELAVTYYRRAFELEEQITSP